MEIHFIEKVAKNGFFEVMLLSCFHPLQAFRLPHGVTFSASEASQFGVPQPVFLPCGRCIGCRLDYSRAWADRCMLEMEYHDRSMFVTLTYDDAHLPKSWSSDLDTGEAVSPVATLVPTDLQLWLKRLRKRTGQYLRFLACGEYGEHTFRPHYHAIIFGLQLDDLIPYAQSSLGYTYYTSQLVAETWPYGISILSDASWETCAYVARYVTKKYVGKDAKVHYESLGIVPEFLRMSRRPGLGRQYFEDHPELWDYTCINVSTPDGGRKIYPPKYYRKLLEERSPDIAKELSKKRELISIRKNNAKKRLTDLELFDILSIEEEHFDHRSKMLIRDTI